MAFDLPELDGRPVLREPWRDRRKRLEDLFGSVTLPLVGIVPVTEEAAGLYDGRREGIVLKDCKSLYRPGLRSPAWLKLKPKLTLGVVVTGGSAERITWGDSGEAVMLSCATGAYVVGVAMRYLEPRCRVKSATSRSARTSAIHSSAGVEADQEPSAEISGERRPAPIAVISVAGARPVRSCSRTAVGILRLHRPTRRLMS